METAIQEDHPLLIGCLHWHLCAFAGHLVEQLWQLMGELHLVKLLI